MKYPTLQKVVLTTMALVASLALSAQAGRQPTTTSGNQSKPSTLSPRDVLAPPQPKAPQVVLYDQYDNLSTNATSSQDFEAAFDPFDDFLADDFVVPGGQTWNVESIDADGIPFNCSGSCVPDSFNVFVYSDSGGLPGTLVYSATGQSFSIGGSTYSITLTAPAVLTAGTYWVSLQARMDFTGNGQWGWTDRTAQSNSPAAWQNPGGGFGTCPSWTVKTVCIPTAGGPDQVYRLNGTTGGGTPTPTPTPTPTCTPIVVNGSIDSGDPIQVDRLFRSGIPQTCPASTTCAIFGDPTPRHYDEYAFTNTTGETQCVTVDTNTACTDTNFIFTGAYLGSFDPNNLCTNWIGDSGSSPNPDQPFQVDLDDGQTLVVAVSEVNPEAGCSAYTVTITGLCEGGGGDLNLVSAASVKGPFAIDLPLSGPSGVEDRSGGPNKKLTAVMTFDQNITSVGSASSTCGTVQSIQIDNADPHNVRVNLVNVAHACNGSTITVTAESISDDQGNVLDSASVGVGLLLGDVNADRVVNRSDTNEAQTHKGQKTDQGNFRSDVNADGRITKSDIELIRQQQGTSLP